jgi:hypothetical protein
MAEGKGKKKNVRGTNPRKRVDAPPGNRKGTKGGPKKTGARTTTRSGDK